MADDEVHRVNWGGIAMLCVALVATLLFIAGVIAAMYFAVQWLGLQAAVTWAAFAGLVLFLIRIEYQRKHEQQRVLAERKREQYFELLELLRKCIYTHDSAQAARRQKQDLQKWSLRLALIGSDEVLRAWHDFCQLSLYGPEYDPDEDEEENEEGDEEDEDLDAEDSLFTAQVKLLGALRRDCGQPATHLTRWELAEMIDLDE